MKKKYEFYLTGEEQHQIAIHFTIVYVILFVLFTFFYYSFASLCLFGKMMDKTLADIDVLIEFILTIILGLSSIPLFILVFLHKNFSPTNEHWDFKQEYLVDGNKMTIHLKGVDRNLEETFIIRKKVETNIGTVYYKSNHYYVVVPYRVKAVEVE